MVEPEFDISQFGGLRHSPYLSDLNTSDRGGPLIKVKTAKAKYVIFMRGNES